MAIIRAIYENGVFKPTQPVSLPEGVEVEIEPRVVQENPGALARELAWFDSRTEADVEAARRRLDALSRPPRSIPEGKSLADMVEGTWPGDETDEQVNEALKRLS